MTAVAVYKALLCSSVLSTMRTEDMDRMSDEIFSRLYNEDRPGRKPRFFRMNDTSSLCRLSLALDRPLAVYKLFKHKDPRKIFDNRRSMDTCTDEDSQRCLRIAFGPGSTLPKAVPALPPLAAWKSERGLAGGRPGEIRGCHISCFLRRLGLTRYPIRTLAPRAGSGLSDLLLWLTKCDKETLASWLRLGGYDAVRIVSHLGTVGKKQRFVKLAELPAGKDLRGAEILTLAVCWDDRYYKLGDKAAAAVNDNWTLNNEFASAAKILSAAALPRRAENKGGDDDDEQPASLVVRRRLPCGGTVTTSGPSKPPCSCATCRQSHKLYPNFSRRGHTQQPYRVQLPLKELMRCLGLWTPENRTSYRKALELSLAAMDVETLNLPCPGMTASDAAIKVAQIGNQRNDGSMRRVQSVAIIGHIDQLDSDGGTNFFTVTPNKGLDKVCAEYLEHVVDRRRVCEERKREILAPLLSLANHYRSAHIRFCQSEATNEDDDDDDDDQGGYFSTLLGRLHNELEKLCRLYVVQGYNSSKFDFPLILPSLAVAARASKDVNIRIRKRGSSVNSLTLTGRRGAGVTFRDPTLLLDASCSLAKLAKMCDAKLEKALLPYRQLDSADCFSRREFSWRTEDWTDELSGTAPAAEEIEEAKRVFWRLRCRNIGDYVRHYLNIDCLLLLKCATSLYSQFERKLDVSPLDVRAFTIAGFSYTCTQLFLYRQCKPPVYMPRVACIYSTLKACTTGGLVEVSRNKVVCGDDGEAGAINPHLYTRATAELLPAVVPPPPSVPSAVETLQRESLSTSGRRRIPFAAGCTVGHTEASDLARVLEDEEEAIVSRPDEMSVGRVVRSALAAAERDSVGAADLLENLRRRTPETANYVSGLDVASEYATCCKCELV